MSRFTVDIYNVDIDKLVYVDILWKILFREEKEFLGENISLQSTHLKHSSGKEKKKKYPPSKHLLVSAGV